MGWNNLEFFAVPPLRRLLFYAPVPKLEFHRMFMTSEFTMSALYGAL